ncbi:T9SS type A sorting domain-containing protein [Hymenobacter sp. BT635]|uniref:T9SS type A sorting domain-containing protein n=1 Tax=Hymenobacter nitidus TaxID=2880929 RepID=A0ABS8A962_9BACT|nr:kelch repeat-containing protein [Hymenobacter nitidus]MCB2376462.1 T9SS type A sorting domain-containing protein [Hymenobacter nitidus]
MKNLLPALTLALAVAPAMQSVYAQQATAPCGTGLLCPGMVRPTLAARALPAKTTSPARVSATWTPIASLSQKRGQHAAVALNGKIYVWGGYVGNANSTSAEFNSLDIYNPATNTWSAGAPLPIVLRGHAHTVGADGQIYSFGGANQGGTLSSGYRYNPNTNVWVPIANMFVTQWQAAAATAPDGKIYVFGGTTDNTLTQIYTPGTNTWTTGAALPVGRHGHVAVLDANGLIHIIGGIADFSSTPLTSHLIYNPSTNTWTTAAALPSGLNQPGGTLGSDGRIYITGGKADYLNNTGPFYNSVYVYNVATNTWTTDNNLPMALAENRSVTVGSDIYTIAGSNGDQLTVAYKASLANTFTWTGATSTAWNVGTNWTGGVVPSASDNVVIPSGLGRYPVVSTSTATASLVTVNSGASLTVADGGMLTVTGNFVNNGTFAAANNATVALSGTTAQAIGGTSITQFRNLTVGSAGATLSGQVEIQRLLTLNGNLNTNSQRFLILSNHVGTAMVVNNGSAVVNGRAVVQRYIDVASNAGFGYRHLSPAVSGATLSNLAIFPILPGAQAPGPLQVNADYNTAANPGLVTPFPTVFLYTQNRVVAPASGAASFDQGWLSPADGSQSLNATQGLTINEPAGNFFELTGTALNTGTYTRTGLARGTQAEAGWHLVGNPYPAPIDWNRVGRTGIDGAAYVYRSTGQYDGGYTAYVNGVGSNVLPMGQAFFVRVSAVGSAGNLTFTNAARETTFSEPTYSRPAQTETRPLVQLTLQRVGSTSATGQDDFYVYEQNGATAGFDSEFDALKVQLNGGEQPSLYQQAGPEALAIQGLPAGSMPRSLALGVHAAVAGAYTFMPTQLLNFAATEPVWLEDKLSGTWHDLRQGAYTAQLSQGLSASRFVLHLHQARPLSSGKGNAWAGELQLYPNPAAKAPVTVVASGVAGTTAELVLVNSIGQHVWQQTAAVSARELRTSVPVADLAKGVYTLQVRSAAGVLTRKLVVQ